MFTSKVNHVSDVISIRVSKKLKRDLEELNINYSDKVREYLEELVRKEKLKRELDNARKIREEIKTTVTPSADLIREDRDASS
ncbi:antitoxin [Sulfolobus tengchongensis]|uniref:Antitoxin n=1 Tax=Sulfolobus tengchongensis TaxID=207809 RepID=A0AAX4L3Q7_9CREN